MPITIEMPRLSDTMEEGTLIKWRVSVGDVVKAGDVLADVETDKATMELETFDDGTVAKLAAQEGDTLPVGALILVLAEEGESVADAASAAGAQTAAQSSSKPQAGQAVAGSDEERHADGGVATATMEAPPAEKPATGGRIRVSPLARKIAEEHGIDLSAVRGSGPDGRIIKRDVLAAVGTGSAPADTAVAPSPSVKPPAAAPAPAPAAPPVVAASSPAALEEKTIPVSNMRKTIARRLVESKTTIPHYTVTVAVNADPLLSLRQTLNEQLEPQGVKLSVNDFIVRAAAVALVQHPMVNSSWTDAGIKQYGTVNIGVAVALPQEKGGGLVVPTIRNAHQKGLRQISDETKALAKKAREQGLTLDEMSDGTFTISNLGMFGVDHFEAIINPPQAAILAVGAAIEKPVARDGELTVGHEMTCTMSYDHRVIDGATGAQFLNTLKSLLENPAVMLV